MELNDLKNQYEGVAKNYGLPGFDELNDEFEIERIDRESYTILRSVRKVMMDKIVGYVRFIEMLINPSQAPFAFMHFSKGMTDVEIKILQSIYQKFIELELDGLKSEFEYSEKNEADSIKKIINIWKDSKGELIKIINFVETNWKADSIKKEKSYFS
ncbi:hypothetical protein AUJ84_01825 [Candidatus Pacearchaeota archaeon CG1_02_32_132]|nr:MAG: hypothetical protein AUJ84_01825 [Candidatus Pacearchaeota archaeon CG1_02_32_132]